MERGSFLKKIGKMAALLASASDFPGLVMSGEANNKINDQEGVWPKTRGVLEILEGRPVHARGESPKGYESYITSNYTNSKTPDAELIESIADSFKRMCREEGFSEMRDLTYQCDYVPMAPYSGGDPYVHSWGANFR